MSTVEQVDDRTTTELALHWACHRAKRCVPKVGNGAWPTPWDKEHADIDRRLDRLFPPGGE